MEVLGREKQIHYSLSLIRHELDIHKIYLYSKDTKWSKVWIVKKKNESIRLNCLNDSKAFIEFSNNMGDIYKNIEEYNSNKKGKTMIDFNEMIGDMPSTKKLNPTVTELVIRVENWNIYFAFIAESYFAIPKNIRLNSTH